MILNNHRRCKAVATCRDLTQLMMEDRIIFIPNYNEKKRELIVAPRSIYGHKVRRKKTIKL